MLTDAELARLREDHLELAEVVEVDRAIAEQRRNGVVSLDLIRLRRECVKAADATWGHQLKGSGDRHA